MTMSGHRVVGLIWSGNGFPRSTLSCQTEAVASRAGLKCWVAEGFSLALRKEMVFLLSGSSHQTGLIGSCSRHVEETISPCIEGRQVF